MDEKPDVGATAN